MSDDGCYNGVVVTNHQKSTEKIEGYLQLSKETESDILELWFHSSEEDMSQIGLEVNPTCAVINYCSDSSQQEGNSVAAEEVDPES